jgi:hypothetical protein
MKFYFYGIGYEKLECFLHDEYPKNKMTFSCFIEKLFDKWYFRLINKKL